MPSFDEIIAFLANSPIRIAVFGEFSCGKSTFLNAMIGEEILSVAVEPTTAVPTYIHYAREFNIIVHRNDVKELHLFEKDSAPFWARFVGRESILSILERQKNDIREFLKEWTKEGEKAELVSKISIQLPLPWLKQGIELVDTPGTNAEFTKHQHYTESVSKETDIAILLMDARHGGGKRTEFEFMNAVSAAVGKCIIVLNKMDTLDEDEREDILEFVRTEALPNHWNGTTLPQVFGLSALVRPGWEKEKNEPYLSNEFASFLSTVERISINERGTILLKHLGNPEQKLFANAQKLEKSGDYDKAHRLYFEIHDILEAAHIELEPAIKGIERCESALRSQVQLIEQANAAALSAFEKEPSLPDEALELLKQANDVFQKHNQQDRAVADGITRISKRIGHRDKTRANIEKLLKICRNEFGAKKLIAACETISQIPPLFNEAELPESQRSVILSEKSRYIEERDRFVAATWQDALVQLSNMDKSCDYSGTEAVISTIERVQSCLGESEIEQRKRLERKLEQWQNYIRAGSAFLDAIGKLAAQPKCRISEYSSAVEKLKSMYSSYTDLVEPSKIKRLSTIEREQQYLVTNDDKISLLNAVDICLHEPAKKLIEDKSRHTFQSTKAFLAKRSAELAKLIGAKSDKVFKQYPDHPEYDRYLRTLVNFRPNLFSRRKRVQHAIEEVQSNSSVYPRSTNIMSLVKQWYATLDSAANTWANVSLVLIILSITALVTGIAIQPEYTWEGESNLFAFLTVTFFLLLISVIPISLYTTRSYSSILGMKLTVGGIRSVKGMAKALASPIMEGWNENTAESATEDEEDKFAGAIGAICMVLGGLLGLLGFFSGPLGILTVILGGLIGAVVGYVGAKIVKFLFFILLFILLCVVDGLVIVAVAPFAYIYGVFVSAFPLYGSEDMAIAGVKKDDMINKARKTQNNRQTIGWTCSHCGFQGIGTIKKRCPNCGKFRAV